MWSTTKLSKAWRKWWRSDHRKRKLNWMWSKILWIFPWEHLKDDQQFSLFSWNLAVLAWKIPHPRKTLNPRSTGWLESAERRDLTGLRLPEQLKLRVKSQKKRNCKEDSPFTCKLLWDVCFWGEKGKDNEKPWKKAKTETEKAEPMFQLPLIERDTEFGVLYPSHWVRES